MRGGKVRQRRLGRALAAAQGQVQYRAAQGPVGGELPRRVAGERRRGKAGERRQILDGQRHLAREPIRSEIRDSVADERDTRRAHGEVLERERAGSDLGRVERELGMGAQGVPEFRPKEALARSAVPSSPRCLRSP